ncbi:MAG TPA: nucleotidyl transferase AbiEii/AbiGii toxin family protein [Elusimicrobiota bacterium]|nr:nucleotidyl transferase AbiEii/AbiGii toxin family protein [Elusimicrobiota bacterium]
MRFSKVLPLLFSALQDRHIDFAMIGGVALYAHGIERTTFDADFLILVDDVPAVEALMKSLGYIARNKTDTFINFSSDDPDMGQVDFMIARKKHSTAMLARAKPHPIAGRSVKVVGPEDMIGLKLLSGSNDPARAAKDRWDIEDLMRRHHHALDWELVKEYFIVFGRENEYEELRKQTS